MAAGFSLNENKIEEFRDFVGKYVVDKIGGEAITPVIDIDATLDAAGQALNWLIVWKNWNRSAPATASLS